MACSSDYSPSGQSTYECGKSSIVRGVWGTLEWSRTEAHPQAGEDVIDWSRGRWLPRGAGVYVANDIDFARRDAENAVLNGGIEILYRRSQRARSAEHG